MTGIIEALVLQVVIPEVAKLLRKEPNLTDEEIIARMEARRDRIIQQGRRFLAETDPTP